MSNLEDVAQIMQENVQENTELFLELIKSLSPEKLQSVPGKKPLPPSQSKHFKKLVTKLADEIVQSWVNYFVYHKRVVAKKLAGQL